MAKLRTASHKVGDEATLRTTAFLNKAGCAVNSLVANDYGFDLHVLLPENPPPHGSSWIMSPSAVHVQVKGGRQVRSGVRLPTSVWRFYVDAPTPTYIAAAPRRGRDSWIESVDRLWRDAPQTTDDKFRTYKPATPRWDGAHFVLDAQRRALLGSPSIRSWWDDLSPDLSACADESDIWDEVVAFVAEVHASELVGIHGPTIDEGTFAKSVESCFEHSPHLRAVMDLICGDNDDVRDEMVGAIGLQVVDRAHINASVRYESQGAASPFLIMTASAAEDSALIGRFKPYLTYETLIDAAAEQAIREIETRR
jgi:hypothetical protein